LPAISICLGISVGWAHPLYPNFARDSAPPSRAAIGENLIGEYLSMKGNREIIKHLNGVLKNELTAINQYFLHSRMLKDWGLHRLAAHEHAESIDEMKHADKLIERILFLEGLPNLQDLHKLMIGENVQEILKCDLKLEEHAIPDLRVAIADCEKANDYVSRTVFSEILESEEEHVDWLETNLGLIDKVGIENYIQSQMHGGDDD
jgi:bacterioferritin